jgi:DNA-binding NarL/FixJ family response regulator
MNLAFSESALDMVSELTYYVVKHTYLEAVVGDRAIELGRWQAFPGKLALRETEACLCVVNGATNKVGAHEMGISVSTFTKNLQRAMYKLNTYTRAETVAEAIRQGIISALLIVVTIQGLMPINDPMPRIRTLRTTRCSMNRRRG